MRIELIINETWKLWFSHLFVLLHRKALNLISFHFFITAANIIGALLTIQSIDVKRKLQP